MGHYKIKYSRIAEIDLAKISSYLAERVKPIVVSKYVEKIKKAAVDISQSPYRCRVIDAKRGLRRQNAKGTSHFILYVIDERRKFVVVMYVFHNKQNWQSEIA